MGRFGWLVAAAVALVAFYLGRGMGPAPVAFPEPREARSASEMETGVARALAEPRAFPRAGALIRLFEGLTQENVDGAARAVEARSGEYDPVDLQLFLTAWTHLDPSSAMRRVQAWPIRSRRELGIRIVMREWAASGRQLEAGSYFDSMTDPAQRDVAAAPLVRGWALAGDADGALALALRFWESDGRRDVIDGLIRGVLHSRGSKGAVALAKKVDPRTGEEFAKRVVQTTLDLAGRTDPMTVAAYYDALLSPPPAPPWLAESLPRIAGLIRNEDPEAALLWLIPKPTAPEQSRALMETMGTWANRDFDAALAFFEQRAESAREPGSALSPNDSAMLAGLLRRMARIRPAQAAPWAVRLRPGSERVEILRRVAHFWSATDAASADAWISSLDLDPKDLDRIREAADWGRSKNQEGTGAADGAQNRQPAKH